MPAAADPTEDCRVALQNTPPPADLATLDTRLAETLTQSFQVRFRQGFDEARAYLTQNPTPNAAVVMDLDETLIDMRAYFLRYRYYVPPCWALWIEEADAPALAEALEFVHWVQARGVHLYFVSGRREAWRRATEENLRKIGVGAYDGLILKPNDYAADRTAVDFKTQARQAIEAKGQPVLVVIGDQASDLTGPAGEKKIQLPNPIYTIP